MKLRGPAIAAAFIALCSCRERADPRLTVLEQEKQSLQRTINTLKTEAEAKDRYILNVTRTLVGVQDQITQMAGAQTTLAQRARDLERQTERPDEQRRQILNDVQKLAGQFKTNMTVLEQLQANLTRSRVRAGELEALVTSMKTRMAADQARVAALEKNLTTMTRRVNRLRTELAEKEDVVREQQTVIEQKDTALAERDETIVNMSEEVNRVYFAVAPLPELTRNGLVKITRSGFLGLRRKKTPTWTFDAKYFTPADMRQETIVLEHALSKLEVLTQHEPGTYELVSAGPSQTLLKITNAQRFWTARYLIVEVRP